MPRRAHSAVDLDLEAIRSGDPGAFIVVADVSLDRMHDVAHAIVGSTSAATGVCVDVLDALHDRRSELTEDDITRASLLLATRRRSLVHLERHGWLPIDYGPPGGTSTPITPQNVHDTRRRVEAFRAASALLGAADTSAVDLHDRHDVDAASLVDALGVTDAAAAQRRLTELRSALDDTLSAFTLWNSGFPDCPALDASLEAAKGAGDHFDRHTYNAIGRHQAACEFCSRARQTLLDPSARLLAAPIIPVAPTTRTGALAAVFQLGARLTTTARGDQSESGDTSAPHDAQTPTAEPSIDELWASTEPKSRRPNRLPDDAAVASAHGLVARSDDELWSPAEPGTTTTAPTVPRAAPTATLYEHDKRRLAVLVTAGAAMVLVAAGAVMALRPSGSEPAAIEQAATEQSGQTVPDATDDAANDATTDATTADEPEVRSLGPTPPPTRPTSTEPAATATTAPAEPLDRSAIIVAAANGANVARAAARIGIRLEEIGYVSVLPLDGTETFAFTTIYFADGFEDVALRLAGDLDLLPSFVAPLASAPFVTDLPENTELLAYVGRDRA